MAESFTLTLDGWERLELALRQAPDVVQQELTAFLHAATTSLATEVRDRTPTDHGNLRKSILPYVEELPGGGALGVVGTSLAHAVPVELGTRPHWPPAQPIEDWVRHKLGLRGKAAKSATRAIRHKISVHGTEGHHMFRDAYAANGAAIQHDFTAAVSRILARVAGSARP